MSGKADYRKLNDGTGASSTYHKKDGTNVRSILNRDAQKQRKLQEFTGTLKQTDHLELI